MFNGAVVGGFADGTVERQDGFLRDEVIKDLRIEGRSIIAFEDKWRAVA